MNIISIVRRVFSGLELRDDFSDPVARFANSGWSTATTPDELIATSVSQSIAKNFDDWSVVSGNWRVPDVVEHRKGRRVDHEVSRVATIIRASDGLRVSVEFVPIRYLRRIKISDGNGRKYESNEYYTGDIEIKMSSVKGIGIKPTSLGLQILKVYQRLSDARVEAEKVAKRAATEMEANEKKWNLAESLLNMKRNEQGALVPIVETPVRLTLDGVVVTHDEPPQSIPSYPRKAKKARRGEYADRGLATSATCVQHERDWLKGV